MESFLNFKQNELFRLDLTYSTKLGFITETIFAEFVSLNPHPEIPEYYLSLTINQIINIDDYLNKGTEYKIVERVIGKDYLDRKKIYFKSNISNS